MKVRLLTDGGYGLYHDEVGRIYDAREGEYGYHVNINGLEHFFYAEEIEIVQEHVYFLETAEDKAALTSLVVIILATLLCMAAVIYVIF